MHRPVPAPGQLEQVRVRVHHVRVADQLEHRQVIGRVAVGAGPGQVESLAVGQRPDRRGLGLAVQQAADQPAGVDAVGGLGDRAERAGEAEPPGQDLGELDRRRRHQPDPLPGLQVLLGQLPGALPDAVGHGVVVDLLAQPDDVVNPVARDERQRGLPGGVDVVGVLGAPQPERQLAPGQPGQVARAEHLAGRQAAGEMIDRGAAHQRVVDVEEGRGGRIGHRRREVDIGNGGRRLAGQDVGIHPAAWPAGRRYRPGRRLIRCRWR